MAELLLRIRRLLGLDPPGEHRAVTRRLVRQRFRLARAERVIAEYRAAETAATVADEAASVAGEAVVDELRRAHDDAP